MTPTTLLKLGLATVGLVVWGIGTRIEHEPMQWTGIAVVALAAILRFWKPKE